MHAHHEAWLKKHPHRSEEWLRARLRDGFHVHHIDYNGKNNHPENLILIDGIDHIQTVHRLRDEESLTIVEKLKQPRSISAAIARRCYSLRTDGYTWPEIAYHLGLPSPEAAGRLARGYSVFSRSVWPVHAPRFRAPEYHTPIEHWSRLPRFVGS